jgi:hypothetical protein
MCLCLRNQKVGKNVNLTISGLAIDDKRACCPAQNNYFTSVQHPLNMAGVSKGWKKSLIKLFPSAHLQSPTLWLTLKLHYQLY